MSWMRRALTPDTFQICDQHRCGDRDHYSRRRGGDLQSLKPVFMGRGEINSPLLWLSQRLAKNRERLGVHYLSDSMASRHLAAAPLACAAVRDEMPRKHRLPDIAERDRPCEG